MPTLHSATSPAASDRIIGRNVRLQRLARGMSQTALALAVLFEGTEPDPQHHAASLAHLLADRRSLRLVRAFARVQDADARKLIVELVEVMALRHLD